MITRFYRALLFIIVLMSLGVLILWAKEDPNAPKRDGSSALSKAAQTKIAAILNINNFVTWHRSPGPGAYGPPGLDGDGNFYPRGTSHVIFADGLVWGGKAYLDANRTQPAPIQLIRVGGNTFQNGVSIGWVNGQGASAVAVSPGDPNARIWRIRRDYTTMSVPELRRDAAENFLTTVNAVTDADIATVVAQYEKDWDEWPVQYGAPYIERNGTPGYQKPPPFSGAAVTITVEQLISGGYDEPGIAGSDPNSPADQVVYTVYNDLSRTATLGFYGSEPLGLEVQLTIWGYKRNDALGQLYFKRFKIINKGGVDIGGGAKGSFFIDSMFVAKWSDPDLGSAGDDLVGCDTTLSMGFVYNANAVDNDYAKYGLPPPAGGYDFLQGPRVRALPTDSAVFNLKRIKGWKNLPMSSYAWFAAGSSISDPTLGTREGGLRWWKMLRGFVPESSTLPDNRYPFPPGVTPSAFPLSGNPALAASNTNLLDGLGTTWSLGASDRRLVLNTGPFVLAPGDTQEIVVGVVAGIGADRLSSVAVMKANDRAVQVTYDLLFQVSKPPAAPLVTATELDGKVILDWGSNLDRVKQTEKGISQPGTYVFEGYNVYQFPTASSTVADAKRLATYDLPTAPAVILEEEFDVGAGAFLKKPVQFGSNIGVKRYYELTRDNVRDIDRLYNGQEYYIGVSAYSRPLEAGYSAALESSPILITVRPRKPFGVVPTTKLGDTVTVTKVGTSDGNATALVISPTRITGNAYSVRFDTTGGTYRVINTTKNITVLTGESNQNADDASPIIDGVQVRIGGAPNDVKDLRHVANPSGPINPPSYVGWGLAFNGWDFPDPSGQVAPVTDWGGGRWGIHTGGAGAGGDESYAGRFRPRTFRGDNFSRFVPYDFELRFTAAGGKAWLAFTSGTVVNVPFELWNIGINTPNDPSDDYRMIPWLNDADANEAFNLQRVDHGLSGGDNDPYTDWIYWFQPFNKAPGQAGYTNEFVNRGAAYNGTDGAGNDHLEVMARMVLVNLNGGSVSDVTWPANVNSLMPATGNVIRINATKPNTPAVVFNYNTASYVAKKSAELEKTSTDRVGVYPNPYYAFNPSEINRFVRFVTFNNLPPKVKVRIFNLAGQLVRVLDKDDPSEFLRWDLNNRDNFPVASGIYIAHLSLTLSDGSEVTKILKIAIIQEQEVPDVF